MNKIEVVIPPGVQAELFNSLGHIPRQCSVRRAKKINALWTERNCASEVRVLEIDAQMLAIMKAQHALDIERRAKRNVYSKNWRLRNPEKIKEIDRRSRIRHKIWRRRSTIFCVECGTTCSYYCRGGSLPKGWICRNAQTRYCFCPECAASIPVIVQACRENNPGYAWGEMPSEPVEIPIEGLDFIDSQEPRRQLPPEVFAAFCRLSLKLKRIVMERVIYGKTLEVVGRMFDVTRENIRQYETKAIRKMRAFIREDKVFAKV